MSLLTFYLMAVAAGFAAGGIAAYMDCQLEMQLTAAGITTIVMACLSFLLRKKLRRPTDAKANAMDKGERVHVYAEKLNTDGTAKVMYRGAEWSAYSTKGSLTEGVYLIDKIDGIKLILEDKISDTPNKEPNASKTNVEPDEKTQDSNTDN